MLSTTPLTVLLVEDNPADADLLIDSLSTNSVGARWQVIHVERLSEAIRCVEQQPIDVVLLDLSLPDCHGLASIGQLHAVDPYLPIVMLTGRDDTQFAVQTVAQGAQDYLIKGQISTPLLTRAICYAIERTQNLKQLQASENRFRAAFDQTFQFMALLSTAGVVLEVNQGLANAEGDRLNALLHRPLWETPRWGYSEAIQQWMKNAVAAAAQGQTVRDEIQSCNPQGELCWLDFSLKPIKDETHQVVLLIVESHDITDRKQAEQQLELQSIVTRNMAEGVCLTRAADGVIVYANPKFERMFGYAAGALVGQHVSVINYEDVQTHTQAVYERLVNQIVETGEATYEVHNVKQDGTPFWCQATTSMFEHPEYGTVFVGVHQDITARKQAEHMIRASLKEKEILLQEIHHRVKNNLQIVYSLLRLQRRRLQNSQAAAVLLESQNRIEAIALVHEKLYCAGDLAHIDASEYIPTLVVNLVSTYSMDAHQVQLELAVEPLPLSMDCAVPCGLMINELVSNAFKYAFPNQRPGQLTVSLRADTSDTQTPYVILEVADNGVGLPAHVSLNNATTLGLQLVSDFVAQLKGTLQFDSTNGTSIRVRFPQSTLRQTPVSC